MNRPLGYYEGFGECTLAISNETYSLFDDIPQTYDLFISHPVIRNVLREVWSNFFRAIPPLNDGWIKLRVGLRLPVSRDRSAVCGRYSDRFIETFKGEIVESDRIWARAKTLARSAFKPCFMCSILWRGEAHDRITMTAI
jgi:hypothetical protein